MKPIHEIKDDLKQYLRDKREVVAAYLFGSVATGKASAKSDVDIAVLFAANLSKEKKFDLRLIYMAQLEDIVGTSVDVVDLSAVNMTFQHRIMRTGMLIYEQDKKKRVEYEVRLRRDYFDFKYYLDRYDEAALKRI